MTKEDIKEALRCCKNQCCSYCPRWCEIGCQYQTLSDALNLITEQEQEIELLKMQMKDVVNHADTFLAEEQKFEAENVKLKSENEDLKDEIIYLERKIAIRDNALKDSDKAIEMLEGKQDTIVKQAKIDVLNKVMTYINNKIENEYGDMSDSVNYLTIDISEFDDFIDELIKEVQNGN